MRLLYVTDSLMAGGIESQLVELVTRLDRGRFDPQVLCLYGPRVRSLHFAPQLAAAGVPITSLDLGWSAADKLRGVAQIAAAVHRLRPEIVQAEGYHANLLTRLARPLLPRVRLIGTMRGAETAKQLRYQRLSYWLCARIVASGAHLKRSLTLEGGVPPHVVEVIANAIDTDRFAESADPGLRQRVAPTARRVLVSLGRISRQKRMHLLAEAMGLLKRQGRLPDDVQLVIAGPVDDPAMQERLEEAIARDALGPQVIQHPPTAHPEDYYHAGDATILFTTLEGISCAMLESLAAGRPVILSEEANAEDVIKDGVTGWVVPTNDVGHLAETLERVCALPDTALRAMRDACRARVRQYDVAGLVMQYTELYEELVRGSRDNGARR